MSTSKLKVKVRDKRGKGYAKKLRKAGSIPAVLYGPHMEESIPLEVEIRELKSFISTRSEGEQVIALELTNAKEEKEKEAIIKDVQRSLLKGEIQHLDFYEITRGEKISTTVPLNLVGESKGAEAGGVVEQVVRELEIECTPENIPPHIDVPLEELDIGDLLRVKDLGIPPNVKVLTNPEEVVVSVLSPVDEEELERLEEERAVETEEVEVIGKGKEEEEETGEEAGEEEEETGEEEK